MQLLHNENYLIIKSMNFIGPGLNTLVINRKKGSIVNVGSDKAVYGQRGLTDEGLIHGIVGIFKI
jgi:hypothetical protein